MSSCRPSTILPKLPRLYELQYLVEARPRRKHYRVEFASTAGWFGYTAADPQGVCSLYKLRCVSSLGLDNSSETPPPFMRGSFIGQSLAINLIDFWDDFPALPVRIFCGGRWSLVIPSIACWRRSKFPRKLPLRVSVARHLSMFTVSSVSYCSQVTASSCRSKLPLQWPPHAVWWLRCV